MSETAEEVARLHEELEEKRRQLRKERERNTELLCKRIGEALGDAVQGEIRMWVETGRASGLPEIGEDKAASFVGQRLGWREEFPDPRIAGCFNFEAEVDGSAMRAIHSLEFYGSDAYNGLRLHIAECRFEGVLLHEADVVFAWRSEGAEDAVVLWGEERDVAAKACVLAYTHGQPSKQARWRNLYEKKLQRDDHAEP